MTLLKITGITLVAAVVFGYEFPAIKDKPKERSVLLVSIITAFLLGTLLIVFPGIPSPIKWVDWLFKPINSLLP